MRGDGNKEERRAYFYLLNENFRLCRRRRHVVAVHEFWNQGLNRGADHVRVVAVTMDSLVKACLY